MGSISAKRVLYFDLLNICACICVVALHCNGIVHSYSEARCWKTSLIVETVAYWAVPVFFMLTGATLMDYRKKYSTKEYFIKRFTKTLIPFIAWSLVFLFLKVHSGDIVLEQLNIGKVLQMILNCEILSIYWFFPALFTVYFAIPVISAIPEEKKNTIFNYMIGYAICFISVIPVLCSLMGYSFNGEFSPAICGGYLLFVIIGYQLTKTELSKKMRIIIYLCGVGGWLIRFLTTLLISQKIGDIYRGFWGYKSFPSVMLAVAVFVWFQYRDWNRLIRSVKVTKGIQIISSASFGVYLLHWLFVWKLPDYLNISTSSWIWRTVGILIVYLLSLVCVLIMKKIFLIKRLVP